MEKGGTNLRQNWSSGIGAGWRVLVVPLPVDRSAEAVEDQEEGSVDDQQDDPEDVVHRDLCNTAFEIERKGMAGGSKPD